MIPQHPETAPRFVHVVDPIKGGKIRAVLRSLRVLVVAVLAVTKCITPETIVSVSLVLSAADAALGWLTHTGNGLEDDEPTPM